MDFYEYLRIIARRWWVLALTVLVVGGGIYWYGVSRPITFDAVSSVHVVKNSEPQALQYDDYYALESSRLLSQLVVGWLADPAIVTGIYQSANVPVPNKSLLQYDRLIRVEPQTGSSLQIVTNAETAEAASALGAAATTVVTERLTELHESNVLGPIFVATSNPLTQPNTPSAILYAVIGAFVGAILGLILVFFVDYLLVSAKPRR